VFISWTQSLLSFVVYVFTFSQLPIYLAELSSPLPRACCPLVIPLVPRRLPVHKLIFLALVLTLNNHWLCPQWPKEVHEIPILLGTKQFTLHVLIKWCLVAKDVLSIFYYFCSEWRGNISDREGGNFIAGDVVAVIGTLAELGTHCPRTTFRFQSPHSVVWPGTDSWRLGRILLHSCAW
jgi:hypothetical protein